MTDTSAATPSSFRALDCARALHRSVLALPALRDSHQTMTKQLWTELFRAVSCPIEDTLVAALRVLDSLQATLESSHAKRALPGISTLRAHIVLIEDYLDQVPLAPACSLPPPSAAHDLPSSGILFRLLQQRSASVIRTALRQPGALRPQVGRLTGPGVPLAQRSPVRATPAMHAADSSRWAA